MQPTLWQIIICLRRQTLTCLSWANHSHSQGNERLTTNDVSSIDIFVTPLFTHELPRLLAKLIYHVSEYANWSSCLCMEMYQGWPNTNHKNFFMSSHKFHIRWLKAALKISLNLLRTKFIQITLKSSSNFTKKKTHFAPIKVLLPTDAQNSCFKRILKFTLKQLQHV